MTKKPSPLSSDVAWRPAAAWAAIHWPKNLYTAVVLVQWRDRHRTVSLEEFYTLSDPQYLIHSAPLDTFRTNRADPSEWSQFAIVFTTRKPRRKK